MLKKLRNFALLLVVLFAVPFVLTACDNNGDDTETTPEPFLGFYQGISADRGGNIENVDGVQFKADGTGLYWEDNIDPDGDNFETPFTYTVDGQTAKITATFEGETQEIFGTFASDFSTMDIFFEKEDFEANDPDGTFTKNDTRTECSFDLVKLAVGKWTGEGIHNINATHTLVLNADKTVSFTTDDGDGKTTRTGTWSIDYSHSDFDGGTIVIAYNETDNFTLLYAPDDDNRLALIVGSIAAETEILGEPVETLLLFHYADEN